MIGHTPAPWSCDWDRGIIAASDGSHIAFLPGWTQGSTYGKANGHLLAAAPDLLAALELLRPFVRTLVENGDLSEADAKDIHAAIGKAEGRA